MRDVDMVRLPDVQVSPYLAAAVRALAARNDQSYAELLRELLGHAVRVCPGCGGPRPTSVSFHDMVAHAQCDQRLAELAGGVSE